MKRLIFVTMIMLFSSVLLKAQEENEKHIIGSTLGISFIELLPNNKFDSKNYGANVFFRKHLKNPNLTSNATSYFSINAEYMRYKENERIRNDYSATLGIGGITKSLKWASLHICTEFGILHKNEEPFYDVNGNLNESSKGFMYTHGFRSGFIIHLPKHINVDVNMRLMSKYKDMICPGFNIGLSYSF